jgi:hypothetical protein
MAVSQFFLRLGFARMDDTTKGHLELTKERFGMQGKK